MEGTVPPVTGDPGTTTFLEEIVLDPPPVVPVEADFAPLAEIDSSAESVERDVNRFQHDSVAAQEAYDAALAAIDNEDGSIAVQEFIRAAKIAETAHEWHLAAVASQRVGDFLLDPKPPHDIARALRMYRRAVAAYELSGLFSEARHLAYRQMYLRMRLGRELGIPLMHRVELAFQWATAGFGYRPLRVVATAAVVITFFALVYWFTQGLVLRGEGSINFTLAFYFSGITFATVGYGDIVPSPALRLVALAEGFCGVFLMGYFVAVLAGRLSKT